MNQSELVRFYVDKNTDGLSLFHVWEGGGARGDSVTPSTYSHQYRTWMADRLVAELELHGGALLSLGCGNAAVEAQVVSRGYPVMAIDAMPQAVELALQKGVNAELGDIYQWTPPHQFTVIYVDGVLGHLYRDEQGLVHVLSRIRSWLAPATASASGVATLVAANDAPNDGSAVQKAPGVDGFYWLSGHYIQEQMQTAGFENVETEQVSYTRPLSGQRFRSVVIGRVSS